MHRVRERIVQHRTAIINELRGLLLEYGIVCAKGDNTVSRFTRRLAGLGPDLDKNHEQYEKLRNYAVISP